MLNLRLVEPQLIVDITGLAELKQAERRGDELVLGACVTHADIEDGRVPDVTRGAMQGVAGNIAYRAVRNRGTIGGSLSHADPAADWVSALSALGAKLTLRSLAGARTVAMEDFIVGALESALRAGEILEAIHVPALPASAHWGYVKSLPQDRRIRPCDRRGADRSERRNRPRRDRRDRCRADRHRPMPRSCSADALPATSSDRFDARVADALLAKAGVVDAADRHIHVTVLKRAVREAAA